MVKKSMSPLVPAAGSLVLLVSGILVILTTVSGLVEATGIKIVLVTVSLVLVVAAIIAAFVAIRQYMHRLMESISVRMEKAIEAPHNNFMGGQVAILESLKDVKDTQLDVARRVDLLLAERQSFQTILNKISVIERRMIAGIETSTLTTTEQIVDEFACLNVRDDQRWSELNSTVNSMSARLNGLAADLHKLQVSAEHHVGIIHAALASGMQDMWSEIGEVRENVRDSDSTVALRKLEQSVENLNRRLSELETRNEERFGECASMMASLFDSRLERWIPELGSELSILRENARTLDVLIRDCSGNSQIAFQQLLTNSKELEGEISNGLPSIDQSLKQFSVIIEEFRHDFERSLSSSVEELLNSPSVLERLKPELEELDRGTTNGSTLIRSLVGEVSDLNRAVQTLVRLNDTSKNEIKALHRHVDRAGIDTVRQVEAAIQLLERVDTSSRRFPESGGFAMNPDSLLLLSDLVMQQRPKRILELGSGTSTIWAGTFARTIGAEVVSVEHLEKYQALTSQMITDFELEDTVDLRLAPLRPTDVGGRTTSWYDNAVLGDLHGVDLLIVDGPPESSGPMPRYPAYPLLRSRLNPGALIIVDDFHREQEAQMVTSWMDDDSSLVSTSWTAGRTGVLKYTGRSST